MTTRWTTLARKTGLGRVLSSEDEFSDGSPKDCAKRKSNNVAEKIRLIGFHKRLP